MITRDVAAGLVLAGVGIFVTREVGSLGYLDEFGPGPGFLPFWLGVLMTALAVALVLSALRGRKKVPKPEKRESGAAPDNARPARTLLAASGLIAMAAALAELGFILSFALLSFFLVYVVERRSLMGAITVAVAITLSFLLLFRIILFVPLPASRWGF